MRSSIVGTLIFFAAVIQMPPTGHGATIDDITDMPYEIQAHILKDTPIEAHFAGATATSKWREMIMKYRQNVVDLALKTLKHLPDPYSLPAGTEPSTVLQDQAALVPLFDGFVTPSVIHKLIRPSLHHLGLDRLDQPGPTNDSSKRKSFSKLLRAWPSFHRTRSEREEEEEERVTPPTDSSSVSSSDYSYSSSLPTHTAEMKESEVASILAIWNGQASSTGFAEFRGRNLAAFYPVLQLALDGKITALVKLTGWAYRQEFAPWVAKHIAPLIPRDLARVTDYLVAREDGHIYHLDQPDVVGLAENLRELNQAEDGEGERGRGGPAANGAQGTENGPGPAATTTTTTSAAAAGSLDDPATNWRQTLLPHHLANNLVHSIILILVQRGNLADLTEYLEKVREHAGVDGYIPLALILAASIEIPDRQAILDHFKPELERWDVEQPLYHCAQKYGWQKASKEFKKRVYSGKSKRVRRNAMVRCHLAVPNNAVAFLTPQGQISLRFYRKK
ncbi:hypothetical protein H4R33_000972 [Dimargaris cristalligena]|nr:hypothetical protein H4R33_000972 [Dimargaris cristalligena]